MRAIFVRRNNNCSHSVSAVIVKCIHTTQSFTVCLMLRCPVVLQDNWEIVEGLRGVPASMQEPEKQGGFLLKRRKWPMKGWHKVRASAGFLTHQTAALLVVTGDS